MSKNKRDAAASEEEEVDDVEETDDETEDEEEADDEEESKDEKSKSKDADDESDEDESEDESNEDDSDDEDDSSSSKNDDELGLDEELEKEKERGDKKPDSDKAKDKFKDRDAKRKQVGGAITEERLNEILAADRKDRQKDEALRLAKGMAGSDKAAALIVAKWANRTFPESLTLSEQITEMYGAVYAKKIIGERNEALRAAKGKQGVSKTDAAGSHREGTQNAHEPKLPANEMTVIKQSGFAWSNKNRRYEKKLPNGRILIRDPKTKQVRLVKA